MLLRTLLLSISFFAVIKLQSQASLPVLRASNAQISIRDGHILRTDYWTASPEINPDIYTADRTGEQKTVTFYSDIDSIHFQLAPQESINFVILLNGVDSCYTRLSSAIRYQPATYDPYQSDTIPFELSERQLTDSYGNAIVTKEAVLPGFQLGSKQFSDLSVSFFEGAVGRQRMSVMGGALLKNFNIIIDFQQANLYFQKRAG